MSFLVFLSGTFIACGQKGAASPEKSAITTNRFLKKYGEIRSPFEVIYLGYILRRLVDGASAFSVMPNNISVRLLDTLEPLAYAGSNGQILVSKGLVLKLYSESELAFVLSHELAHLKRGHSTSKLDSLSSEERAQLELEADNLGVGILASAGYDPRDAVSALQHSYYAEAFTIQSYPELRKRLRAIQGSIADSGWKPPGTRNRRDFVKFKQQLAAKSMNASALTR